RERNGGAQWDRSLDKVLRHATPAFVARRADARRGLCGRCALFHRREKTKKEKTATTETGGLTLMEPSLIPPPGRLTNRGHLTLRPITSSAFTPRGPTCSVCEASGSSWTGGRYAQKIRRSYRCHHSIELGGGGFWPGRRCGERQGCIQSLPGLPSGRSRSQERHWTKSQRYRRGQGGNHRRVQLHRCQQRGWRKRARLVGGHIVQVFGKPDRVHAGYQDGLCRHQKRSRSSRPHRLSQSA